ncbi:uncharacterized protein LOC103513998, partial [Diaphorina citri]|uniref:Uncharacterized protein LOC103513998 n=1 Tax=Diaphorina citri TaxID=121845 RepID=A0A1S3D9A4_DIACI
MDDLKEAFDSKQTSVQYFHNSQTHKIKLRAIQNILLLDDAADKILLGLKALSVKQNLFVWGLENVLKYNHQPSVRYYLEWLIIRNLLPMKHFRKDIFWTFFAQAYDERPGSIVSFLSIIYHVSRKIITLRSTEDHTEKQLKFIDEAMEQLISCSMSQLFNLRLYANVVFLKLYDNLTGESWSELRKKYEMVFKAMMKTKTSAKGNAILNADKLSTDFYFTEFDPFTQFNPETIFHDLPRLLDVACDEWIYWDAINRRGTLYKAKTPEWIVTNNSRQCTGFYLWIFDRAGSIFRVRHILTPLPRCFAISQGQTTIAPQKPTTPKLSVAQNLNKAAMECQSRLGVNQGFYLWIFDGAGSIFRVRHILTPLPRCIAISQGQTTIAPQKPTTPKLSVAQNLNKAAMECQSRLGVNQAFMSLLSTKNIPTNEKMRVKDNKFIGSNARLMAARRFSEPELSKANQLIDVCEKSIEVPSNSTEFCALGRLVRKCFKEEGEK